MRKEIDMDELGKVAGGSYSFSHRSGKCCIGNMESDTLWQITADYDMVQSHLDAVMNGPGTDDEKNAKMINLIVSNGWGTQIG